MTDKPELRILRVSEACARVGLSKSSVYRLESEGRFPKRIKLSENSTGYYLHEIEEFMANLPRAADVA